MLDFAKNLSTDVLVIGSGAAGCAAAITADEYGAKVLMIAKGTIGRSGNTNLAGVVFAAALGHTDPRDNSDVHLQDTIMEGRFLGDQRLAKIMAEESPHTVYDLQRYGLPWYKMKDGIHFLQAPTPGHRYHRGVHYDGRTGQMVQTALSNEVKRHPDIQTLDDILITDLLKQEGRVIGAAGIDLKSGEMVTITAGSTIVATGGAGKIFQVTDMETGSTGDGMVWCLRAGATYIDPEMHQFFPTAFVYPETLRGTALATSALWIYGLRMFNNVGERFMEKYYPEQNENVPRDVLSQCILKEILEGRGSPHGGVWLDTYAVENWEHWQRDRARTYVWPAKMGVDVRRAEVAPSSHFTLGGIRFNECAETGVEGLYVAGEVAGGIHGANRIGGNALAECMVFGEIAGRCAALAKRDAPPADEKMVRPEQERLRAIFERRRASNGSSPMQMTALLRKTMYNKSGVVRSEALLQQALADIQQMQADFRTCMQISEGQHFNVEWIRALELQAMLTVSEITVRAAALRKESRGAHFRVDYPSPDNTNWLKHTLARLDGDALRLSHVPVEFPYVTLNPDQTEPPFRKLEAVL